MNRTFRSLGIHNYRLWFIGASVSNVGTWMQRIAQDWLVLTVLTRDSGVAVGITTARIEGHTDSTGAAVLDGDVTATGGGGALQIASTSLSPGVTVDITALSFTMPLG